MSIKGFAAKVIHWFSPPSNGAEIAKAFVKFFIFFFIAVAFAFWNGYNYGKCDKTPVSGKQSGDPLPCDSDYKELKTDIKNLASNTSNVKATMRRPGSGSYVNAKNALDDLRLTDPDLNILKTNFIDIAFNLDSTINGYIDQAHSYKRQRDSVAVLLGTCREKTVPPQVP